MEKEIQKDWLEFIAKKHQGYDNINQLAVNFVIQKISSLVIEFQSCLQLNKIENIDLKNNLDKAKQLLKDILEKESICFGTHDAIVTFLNEQNDNTDR